MKVKAVIMKPEHTNDVYIPKKKEVGSNTFSHGGYTYFLDADHFQITWKYRRPFRRYYITYYYKQGMSKPLPVPDFSNIQDNGVSAEELAAIFNPYFLRIIAPFSRSVWEHILFLLVIGIALGEGYLIYAVHKLSSG